MSAKTLVFGVMLAWCLPQAGVAQLTYAELTVLYDSAWTYKNLQLIPVRFKGSGNNGLSKPPLQKGSISLEEALAKGKIKVREMTGERGADLNLLQVTNTSKQDVIAPAGDILQGGKQDRVIGETTVIPAGGSSFLNVFCIEKGRWDDKATAFLHAGAAGQSLRKVMDRTGRQHEVWKEIERQFASENKVSQTWPYLKLRRDAGAIDTGYFRYFMGRMKESDSAYAGFLAITGDKILNCELFSSTDVLNVSYPSMLKSWIESALAGAIPVLPRAQKENFMDKLLGSEESQSAFIATHGKRHKYQGRVVHCIAYGQ